jgi:hypothetical protein
LGVLVTPLPFEEIKMAESKEKAKTTKKPAAKAKKAEEQVEMSLHVEMMRDGKSANVHKNEVENWKSHGWQVK